MGPAASRGGWMAGVQRAGRDGPVTDGTGAARGGSRGVALATLALALVLAWGGTLAQAAGLDAAFGPSPQARALAAAELTAPKITKQPTSKTVEEGQSVSFEATASGAPTPTVQWELSVNGGSSWSAIEGASATQLTIASAGNGESGHKFRAVFTNSAGKATSAAATLTVQEAPAVTRQPASTTVEEGQNAVFEAAASGFPVPTIKWELSSNGGETWTAAPGGTTNRLTVTAVKTSQSGRLYRVTYKNVAGTTTSEVAVLTVQKTPAITKQPTSVIVEEGQNAMFEATASGFPAPTVQWQLSSDGGTSWEALAEATTNQLTVPSTTTAQNGRQYRAVFTNAAGQVTSATAVLTVRRAPAVTQQPSSTTVEEGQSASFEAAASGFPAPTVQWELSSNGGSTWSAISGANSTQLTIALAKTSESGRQYRAVFTNAAGAASTSAATLTVQKAPAVTKQPVSTTADEGQSASFEAAASGFPAPAAQWELSEDSGATWTPLAGANSSQLTLSNLTLAQSGDEYRVSYANPAGHATSEAATLTVQAPPVLTRQPANTTVEQGQSAVLEAAASGSPEPTVQWETSTNGGSTWSALAGATSDQLTIANTKASETGTQYRAVFTNAAGKATSTAATLTVATIRYTAFGWGQNQYRQLGSGSSNALSSVPVTAVGLHFITAVAAGARHSLALRADGTVAAWGANEFGQLGSGTGTMSETPVTVQGLSGVKAIAAGAFHSLALLSNGTVVSWGDNESGQLGNGSTKESEVPVAVKGLTGVRGIAAGADFSLALLSNGTVMAWGDGESGQLGNGKTTTSTTPVAVKGLTGVAAISAGGNFSLALLNKETVVSWGGDEYGQLGVSGLEAEFSDVPVAVGSLNNVTGVAAGSRHGLALLGNGTVKAWGRDNVGQLGNATTKPFQETPVAVSGISSVAAVSAGGSDSAALLAGGSAMSWGSNEWGTLGNGTTGSPSMVPVAVTGLSQIAGLSVGAAHMLAYGEPLPTITSVSPKLGSSAGGTSVTVTGVNLAGATAVRFGSVEATSFTVESSTTLTALAPPGTGAVDIRVTSEAGVSQAGAADRFTYQHPPTVTKLSVKAGATTGGTSVTITGTEFTGATQVRFGSLAAAYTVDSPTSITASAPAQGAGIVHLTVTNSAGMSATSSKDQFKYTPTVEAVSPSSGPLAGGTRVTVTGTGFAVGATTFKFGKRAATAVSCSSATSCAMTAPAGEAIGTVNVLATVNKALSPVNVPGDQFSYG
jgi:alpha-tubulin suppressor-like RCC1 family protein